MTGSMNEYLAALERLKKRKAKINNDTVAIEANRKKGSIKKSRSQFTELIKAIDDANRVVNRSKNEASERLENAKDAGKSLRQELDASLVRELSLLKEVFELRKELVALRGGNVIPIRGHPID